MKEINKTLLIFFLLITLISNGNARNIVQKKASKEFYLTNSISKVQQNESPILFLRDFFKWYKTKFDYLDNHIFPVAMDLKTNPPYRINFNETEKYLSILKTSGFFSDNYILNYRSYFKKIDLNLQKTKQNDDTVDGLDYDPIVHSQEPESMLKNLNNIRMKIVKSTENDVTIKVQTPFNQDTYLLYYLKKSEGRYLIDKIDFYIGGKVQD